LAVGLLFGLAVAVAVTLAGPLLLFNPWVASALQARHAVAASFDTSQAEIDRVTGDILGDLYVTGPFDAALVAGQPLLDERERSHMVDVSRLVQLLAGITLIALITAVLTGAWLGRERRRRGRIMLISAGVVGALAILLAGTFAVAFEPAFLVFHEIFFSPDTYVFAADSNLIRLFPEAFWYDASLAAGAAIIGTALVVSLLGLRGWRGGQRTPEQA
jgi:integral membrane protein (TIGR01906 family)